MLLAECAHGDAPAPDVTRLNAKYGFSYGIPYSSGWRDHHVILCFLCREDYRGASHELVDGVLDRLKALLPPPPALTIRSEDEFPAEGLWTFLKWDNSERHESRPLQSYESERVAPLEARRMLQLAAAGQLRVSGFKPPHVVALPGMEGNRDCG